MNARRSRPVPIHAARARQPDSEAGRLWVADDFDAPLPSDLLDAFEGREHQP